MYKRLNEISNKKNLTTTNSKLGRSNCCNDMVKSKHVKHWGILI